MGIKKYIQFFKNLNGEKYYIQSAKRYLFMPMIMLWLFSFVVFIFARGELFWLGAFPILFFVFLILISYSKFWALFSYSKIAYYTINVGALILMYIVSYPVHLLWNYLFEYVF